MVKCIPYILLVPSILLVPYIYIMVIISSIPIFETTCSQWDYFPHLLDQSCGPAKPPPGVSAYSASLDGRNIFRACQRCLYAKSLWVLKHAKTGRDRPVKPYPDAPWCWNSYLHLPQKLPKGKYSIHGAYGILDPWYSSIPISVPTPSALSSLTSFDCWGHKG